MLELFSFVNLDTFPRLKIIFWIKGFTYEFIYGEFLVIWNHSGQQQQARRGERPLGGTVTPQTDPLGAGAGQTIIIIQTRNQLGLHWLGGEAATGGAAAALGSSTRSERSSGCSEMVVSASTNHV